STSTAVFFLLQGIRKKHERSQSCTDTVSSSIGDGIGNRNSNSCKKILQRNIIIEPIKNYIVSCEVPIDILYLQYFYYQAQRPRYSVQEGWLPKKDEKIAQIQENKRDYIQCLSMIQSSWVAALSFLLIYAARNGNRDNRTMNE
ncbi:hypothetical protein ACJX0J_007279, partial [Zea mays]